MKKHTVKGKYLFCYEKELSNYLTKVKSIEYITKAKHTVTDKIYTLYEFSEEVRQGIDEYKQIKK